MFPVKNKKYLTVFVLFNTQWAPEVGWASSKTRRQHALKSCELLWRAQARVLHQQYHLSIWVNLNSGHCLGMLCYTVSAMTFLPSNKLSNGLDVCLLRILSRWFMIPTFCVQKKEKSYSHNSHIYKPFYHIILPALPAVFLRTVKKSVSLIRNSVRKGSWCINVCGSSLLG